MPVKIRLMRIGARKRPFYRVVAVDERKKRTGGYIESLGTYNPLTTPHEVILKQDRIDVWIKNGAVLSHGFLRVIGKAPQKPPRKAKKVKEEKPVAAAPAEEVTETPVTEAAETPVVEETQTTEPAEAVAEEAAPQAEEPAAEEVKTEEIAEAEEPQA